MLNVLKNVFVILGLIYDIHLCFIGVFNKRYEKITEAYLLQSTSTLYSINFYDTISAELIIHPAVTPFVIYGFFTNKFEYHLTKVWSLNF